MPGSPAVAPPPGAPSGLSAATVTAWCERCVHALTEYRQEIDDLNVFPVPDGDTGTNLLLTLRAAADRVAGLAATAKPATAAQILAAMAKGALLGARGNSGVIASQLLRGLAEAALDPAAAPAHALTAGLARAVTLAYEAVAEPVEGTILTVARSAAQAAAARLAAPGAGQESADHALAGVSVAAAEAAAVALTRTPSQLPALAIAGVVDAGGKGLVVLLEALVDVLTGQPQRPATPVAASRTTPAARDTRALERAREAGSDAFGYEVQYLLDADADAVPTLRSALAALGDSLVIVGSGDGLWKVHIHVNDVGAAIEAGLHAGRPEDISVQRFRDQIQADRSPAWAGRAVVAVAPGEGLGELFEAERVTIVDGGPGNNPCTADVLAVIRGTGAAEVVVLPNHRNVTGVADAAAAQARAGGQDVAVVPTRSSVQGLAAVAVTDAGRRFADDVIAMAEAAAATRWAEVTVAQRDAMTMAGRCQAGDALGLADGDVVLIGHSVTTVACDLVDRLLLSGGELATVIIGADAEPGLSAELSGHLKRRHPTVEVVVYHGGQPHYPLLLGIE